MGRRGYQLLLEEISIVRLDIAIIALISTEHYSCERTTCRILSETVRSCSRQQSISFTAHDEPFDRIPLVAEDELVSPSGEVKPAACMQLCVESRWIDLERILPAGSGLFHGIAPTAQTGNSSYIVEASTISASARIAKRSSTAAPFQ